ncbi:hypothetical protein JTB14_009064 [Gonioctena quinquepunctata]|nr:hypothetical protein JTB14_009064 [Gonioctena quinquepunctata]
MTIDLMTWLKGILQKDEELPPPREPRRNWGAFRQKYTATDSSFPTTNSSKHIERTNVRKKSGVPKKAWRHEENKSDARIRYISEHEKSHQKHDPMINTRFVGRVAENRVLMRRERIEGEYLIVLSIAKGSGGE